MKIQSTVSGIAADGVSEATINIHTDTAYINRVEVIFRDKNNPLGFTILTVKPQELLRAVRVVCDGEKYE